MLRATVITQPAGAVNRAVVAAKPVAIPHPHPAASAMTWHPAPMQPAPIAVASVRPMAVALEAPAPATATAASLGALLGKRARQAPASAPAPLKDLSQVHTGIQNAQHDAADVASMLLSLPHATSAAPRGGGSGANVSGTTSPTSRAASPVGTASAPTAGEDGHQRTKRRHNETERRRVEKLRLAYKELEEAMSSRPELFNFLSSADDAAAGRDADAPDTKRARPSHSGGARGKSHIEVLHDASAVVRGLYALVEEMASGQRGAASEAAVAALRGAAA